MPFDESMRPQAQPGRELHTQLSAKKDYLLCPYQPLSMMTVSSPQATEATVRSSDHGAFGPSVLVSGCYYRTKRIGRHVVATKTSIWEDFSVERVRELGQQPNLILNRGARPAPIEKGRHNGTGIPAGPREEF